MFTFLLIVIAVAIIGSMTLDMGCAVLVIAGIIFAGMGVFG